MSVIRVFKDGNRVAIEEENLAEWEANGYSTSDSADTKAALIEKAISLSVASPSVIKRMSIDKLNEKITEAEAEE